MYNNNNPNNNNTSVSSSYYNNNTKVLPAGGIKISYKSKKSKNNNNNNNNNSLNPEEIYKELAAKSLPTSSEINQQNIKNGMQNIQNIFNNKNSVYNSNINNIHNNSNNIQKNLGLYLNTWSDYGPFEFNQHFFDDDTVLNFLYLWQQECRAEVKENEKVLTGGEKSIFYEITWITNSIMLKGTGCAKNKKDAKKGAAKDLLLQLGRPSKAVYDQLTGWMAQRMRSFINAKATSNVTSEGDLIVHKLTWTSSTNTGVLNITSEGKGRTPKEASLAAVQNMYIQVLPKKAEIQAMQSKAKEAAVEKAAAQAVSQRAQAANVVNNYLSKHDSSEINKQHNATVNRFKIQPSEVVDCVNGTFQCTLQWKWKNAEGRTQTLSTVGCGASKALSRAEAALDMMIKTGMAEMIAPADRGEAREIKDLAKSDMNTAVNRGCELIKRSRGGVWSLFLPELWKCVLAQGSHEHANRIINTLILITTDPKSERRMPPDLWETLLDECTVLTNHTFGQSILHTLGELPLETKWFPSELALNYFATYRLLLALEWQAQVANVISEKKEFSSFFDTKSLVLNIKNAVLPVVSLQCTLRQDERDWLMNLSMRENDYVLIRPYDNFSEYDSWERCTVGEITSLKNDFTNFQVNLRLLSGEGTKHPDTFTSSQMKFYHLSSTVTHDRMVQALRALTQHRTPPSQCIPPYSFTPEIRYLLLHTLDNEAQNVAGRAEVPHLIDVDPMKYHPFFNSSETDKKKKKSSPNGVNPPTLLHDLAMQINNQLNEESNGFSSMNNSTVKLPTDLPLTESQAKACLSALTNRLTLVQGPPGTGKTHVACAIIDSWTRQDPTKKILAVADSNVAADNLMEGLKKRNIRAVRIGSGSECDFQDDAISDMPRYKEYMNLKENGMYKEARISRMTLFREAVKKYNIVIATCVGSGHEMFDDMCFQRVIIDECAQAIEPSTLIPLGHSCNNLVLIGDHKQLPPTIVSSEASLRGLDVSLLERFVKSNSTPIYLLDTQRRMHPSISEFPNIHFYDGKLKNADVDDVTRPLVRGFAWPNKCCRLCLINVSPTANDTEGFERSHSTSKYNLMEIPPILSILQSCMETGSVNPDQIGVLTPYDAQKVRLRKIINESFPPNYAHQIEIDSVDGFQGKEKDLILFSAVRSNLKGEVGFLEDARRMNVMLTRARRGTIIVADQYTLSCETVNWRPWLQYVEAHRSIIPHALLKNYLDGSAALLLEESTLKMNMSGNVNTGGVSTPHPALLRANNTLGSGLSFLSQGFQSQWHGNDANINTNIQNNNHNNNNNNNNNNNDNNKNNDQPQPKKKNHILQEEEEFERSRLSKNKGEIKNANVVEDWEELI